MFLITCGTLVAFIDHAGVYILKLCPWCSLDLQDKLKQLPVLTLLAGQVFYYSSLGQQFGAVIAWEMFGAGFVVPILIPSLLYTAFQKRKAAVADGSLLMPLCEDNVPTPTNGKQTSIGNLTGLNFAMESATAVWDPNSTAFPSSQAQSQVALTYLPFALAHTFTDVGILIFMAIFWSMMDQDSRAKTKMLNGFRFLHGDGLPQACSSNSGHQDLQNCKNSWWRVREHDLPWNSIVFP